MNKNKIILFFLFFTPVFAEVLTGSTTPKEFLNPVVFVLFVLLYGCSALLIREAVVAWNLQWSAIFLGIAFGVFEEGMIVQSFTNPFHNDLGILSGYGVFLGVQIPWAIILIILHSSQSTLVPLLVSTIIWPESRNERVMGMRGIVLNFVGIFIVSFIWLYFCVYKKSLSMYLNYEFSLSTIVIMAIIVVFFILLAFFLRYKRVVFKTKICSEFCFFTFGFLFPFVNLFLPNILAKLKVKALIVIWLQIFFLFITVCFLVFQFLNENFSLKEKFWFINGIILFWILIDFLLAFFEAERDMLLIGISFLFVLIYWIRKPYVSRDFYNP